MNWLGWDWYARPTRTVLAWVAGRETIGTSTQRWERACMGWRDRLRATLPVAATELDAAEVALACAATAIPSFGEGREHLAQLAGGHLGPKAVAGAPAQANTLPPGLSRRAEAADLLRHIRDELHCHVVVEADHVLILPTYRCPTGVAVAALALADDIRAIIESGIELPPACDEAPTEADVDAFAEALAANPAHQITDHNTAMRYFRAQVRHRLATTKDPMVRGILLSDAKARATARTTAAPCLDTGLPTHAVPN